MTTTVSPTMLRIEGLRQLRNPYTLAFTLAMPVAMYLLFGAGMGTARSPPATATSPST